MSENPPIRLAWNESPPAWCRGGAVTVGNFDGVHIGHKALVEELGSRARDLGGPAIVISFDPHPLLLLAPERFQPLLTAPDRRADLLQQSGADTVFYLRTSDELLRLSPEEFFQRILCDGFGAKAIVEGFNFRFGRERAGSVESLTKLCHSAGIRCLTVPPLELDGAPVSSSRVRNALLAGDVSRAANLLGRMYLIRGIVGEGARRGRDLGFPTANLQHVETLIPANGVYAVGATVAGRYMPGAANVGPNPTFGEHERKVEVHLLNFDGDLYGHTMDVEFIERLRDTRPFASAVELVEQLKADVRRVRDLISGDR
jgi:riboflavin kinase/FMN adenylyltransferase